MFRVYHGAGILLLTPMVGYGFVPDPPNWQTKTRNYRTLHEKNNKMYMFMNTDYHHFVHI